MDPLQVNTESVIAFGATTAAMAADLQAAGLAAAASSPALLAPVFGLIGGDFLAVFTQVHTAHLASIENLSGVVAGISAAAVSAAGGYKSADEDTTSSLGSTGSRLV